MLELVKPEERAEAIKCINIAYNELNGNYDDLLLRILKSGCNKNGLFTLPPFAGNKELITAEAKGRLISKITEGEGTRLVWNVDTKNSRATISLKADNE